jgi:uncharacterized membrane protein YdfJ with MMPL/SSD domain
VTGNGVMFTGVTLAIGVATWIFSPLKFQADMGILLAFLFLMNMVGALLLLPALARFLLGHQPAPGLSPDGRDRISVAGARRAPRGRLRRLRGQRHERVDLFAEVLEVAQALGRVRRRSAGRARPIPRS